MNVAHVYDLTCRSLNYISSYVNKKALGPFSHKKYFW